MDLLTLAEVGWVQTIHGCNAWVGGRGGVGLLLFLALDDSA